MILTTEGLVASLQSLVNTISNADCICPSYIEIHNTGPLWQEVHVKIRYKTRDPKEEKTMPIKIHTKKITQQGRPYRVIERVEMLSKKDLPEAYTKCGPCCWSLHPYDAFPVGPISHDNLQKKIFYKDYNNPGVQATTYTEPIPEERFQALIKFLRKCGKRLHDINSRVIPGFDGSREVITI
jgi:hypothetical protein